MKRIAMLIVALGTSITLAACGSNDSTTGASPSTAGTSASTSASEHNPACLLYTSPSPRDRS